MAKDLILALGLMLLATPAGVTAQEPPAFTGFMTCPVCGTKHHERHLAVLHNGRHYYLDCERCRTAFVRAPEDFARRVEPHAALFHTPDPSRPRYGRAVFWFGAYVVIALLCGALAAYAAVHKGRSGARWFAAGALLNVLGVAIALLRPAGVTTFPGPGLTRMPATHAPVPCAACGRPSHPSATRCAGCGAALAPTVESEVERARPGDA